HLGFERVRQLPRGKLLNVLDSRHRHLTVHGMLGGKPPIGSRFESRLQIVRTKTTGDLARKSTPPQREMRKNRSRGPAVLVVPTRGRKCSSAAPNHLSTSPPSTFWAKPPQRDMSDLAVASCWRCHIKYGIATRAFTIRYSRMVAPKCSSGKFRAAIASAIAGCRLAVASPNTLE